MKWVKSQGCLWGVVGSAKTCAFAAEGGHLETLQWVRGPHPPCPWDKNTCTEASRDGHLEVLKLAFENGCLWSGGYLEVATPVIQACIDNDI